MRQKAVTPVALRKVPEIFCCTFAKRKSRSARLFVAGAVSMAWQSHSQASPDECATASTRRQLCSHPLEGQEPSAASTGVHAAPAPPTHGGADGADPLCQPRRFAFAPFPYAAG